MTDRDWQGTAWDYYQEQGAAWNANRRAADGGPPSMLASPAVLIALLLCSMLWATVIALAVFR